MEEIQLTGPEDMIVPEEAGLPRQTIADLIYRPCPNNPRGSKYSGLDGEFCERSSCVFCPAAGCVWTTGFCVHGHWKKLPSALEFSGPSLDPRVWSNLPPELLGSVLARLPTDGIGRARTLSKGWKLAMSSSSDVAMECSKSQPSLCALMGFSIVTRTCWVRVYDTSARKWHAFSIDSIPTMYATSIKSCDAGLACFVACGVGLNPVLVCNPLTREWGTLPLQRLVLNEPRMVLLRVDRDSGSYKVTLVGHGAGNAGVVAEVYDSVTKEWAALVSGKVLDYFWPWPARDPHPGLMTLGVYDCSAGELREYKVEHFPARPLRDSDVPTLDGWGGGWKVEGLAIYANDLYLLEAIPPSGEVGGYTKYNVSKHEDGHWGFTSGFGSTAFAKFDTAPGEIVEFEMDDLCLCVTLFVCKTFFLVVGGNVDSSELCNMKLYDVESGKWTENFEIWCKRDLWHSIMSEDLDTAFVCELRWDACP